MPVIAAMIADPDEQLLVRQQLTGVAAPRFCETLSALEHLVETAFVRAVLTDVRDSRGTAMLPALRQLRARAPELPIILCFRPAPEALRDAQRVMRSVSGVGIVLRGFEHIGLAMKRVLVAPPPPSAAETLLRRIVPLTPASLQPFFTICSLKASPRLRVGAAAALSQIPRRTLERRLAEADLPGAARVVGSCAALHAAWWLDVQHWPTKQVIHEMRFSHPSALTRSLQRHFECSVLQLRDRGGFKTLLLQFEHLLRRSQS